MIDIPVFIEVLSPLHLGVGEADVNYDAGVVHEACGLPYFPAKRFRGLLYESALEIVEMGELCRKAWISRDELDACFGRKAGSEGQVIFSDLHYKPKEGESYDQVKKDLEGLESQYGKLISPQDVLRTFLELRVQTSIDQETGTAKDGSLRNMYCLHAGIAFEGTITISAGGEVSYEKVLTLAAQNLHAAGGKRSRGFGRIQCWLSSKKEQEEKIKEVLGS